MTGVTVRLLKTPEEFQRAVCLQQAIWGFEEVELLPVRMFVVASKIGGQSFGAFDGERMIGFSIAIPGLKPGGKPYLHSHMVGVLPNSRNRGVGRMLKLQQRLQALGDGIDLIEWTFDPLELKNAFFNIERLGAVVRRYVLNQYGTTTSRLHGGLPTDRCVAEWHLASRRVKLALAGDRPNRGTVLDRIEVPADIHKTRAAEPQGARAIQRRVSERFMEAASQGLAVIGFDRPGTYLLGRWPSE